MDNPYESMDLKIARKYNAIFGGVQDLIKKAKNGLSNREIRTRNLEKVMNLYGVQMRDDSYFCDAYINEHEYTTFAVAQIMIIMNFFFSKTDYSGMLSSLRTRRWNENRDEDYEFRKYYSEITEDDKDDARFRALDKFINKCSLSQLPPLIYYYYRKYLTTRKKYDVIGIITRQSITEAIRILKKCYPSRHLLGIIMRK
jgi:hypothetical protein